MSRIKELIHEIHRRSLWQVLGIYLVGATVAYQVIQSLTEGLGLPPWFPAFAIVLFIVGLPIVLATAFVEEGIGLRSAVGSAAAVSEPGQAAVPSDGAPGRGIFTWRNAIVGALVVFAAWGAFALGWVVLRGGAESGIASESEAAATGETAAMATAVVSLETDPSGANVTATPVGPDGAINLEETIEFGSTPVSEQALAAGEYLFRFEAEGRNALELLIDVKPEEQLSLTGRLMPADEATESMVFVDGGTYPGAPEGLAVQAFLIDRYEVTNAQYLEFVSAGGYDDPSYWQEMVVMDGRATGWSDAIETLVDRTGMTGPRGWSGGLYLEGKSDHPVVDITWYEASAFASWAGKELPTWDQWWRAALGDSERAFPWGDDAVGAETRANFGMIDTEPVGSRASGVSPFGVHDMAGNVREWLRGLEGDPLRACTVGGSWNAPAYTFDKAHASEIDPGFSSSSVGFRCVSPAPGR